jgi:hypothetical protein
MDGRNKQKDRQRTVEPGTAKSFVGTSKEVDTSGAYLSEDDTGETDLAEQVQGVLKSRAGSEDVESGTSAMRDAVLDDGS